MLKQATIKIILRILSFSLCKLLIAIYPTIHMYPKVLKFIRIICFKQTSFRNIARLKFYAACQLFCFPCCTEMLHDGLLWLSRRFGRTSCMYVEWYFWTQLQKVFLFKFLTFCEKVFKMSRRHQQT